LTALGIDLKKSVEDLHILRDSTCQKSLVTASPNDLAIDLYKKMAALKVAGVPIVDE
jgi:CBS domain-containing protein